jgi:hypothetical protein
MKLNQVPLLLLLPLVISACDSQQPSYSASNANSAPAPAPQQAPAQEAPPPNAPHADAPPAMAAAEKPPVDAAPKAYSVAAAHHVAIAGGSLPEHEVLAPVNPTGIGGCDSYIERYRACVNNGVANRTMSNPSKFALVHTFNRQMRKWQADVKSGDTAGLVTACAEADKQARPDLVQAGCSSF